MRLNNLILQASLFNFIYLFTFYALHNRRVGQTNFYDTFKKRQAKNLIEQKLNEIEHVQ